MEQGKISKQKLLLLIISLIRLSISVEIRQMGSPFHLEYGGKEKGPAPDDAIEMASEIGGFSFPLTWS